MSTIHEALGEPGGVVAASGCTAAARAFVAPAVALPARPFSLPTDPFAAVRRELDAFAWSLFGRMVEEAAAGEIPLDRGEGSL